MNLPKGFTHEKGLNKDAAAIKHVIFTTLEEYGLPLSPGNVDSDLNAPEDFYKEGYFAVIKNEEGEIVGTFGLLEYRPGEVEIRKMYLLKAYRGKGIGHYMMQVLLKKAKDMNYPKVILETASALVEAIMMYEKYGFQLEEEGPHVARCDRVYSKLI